MDCLEVRIDLGGRCLEDFAGKEDFASILSRNSGLLVVRKSRLGEDLLGRN